MLVVYGGWVGGYCYVVCLVFLVVLVIRFWVNFCCWGDLVVGLDVLMFKVLFLMCSFCGCFFVVCCWL